MYISNYIKNLFYLWKSFLFIQPDEHTSKAPFTNIQLYYPIVLTNMYDNVHVDVL